MSNELYLKIPQENLYNSQVGHTGNQIVYHEKLRKKLKTFKVT